MKLPSILLLAVLPVVARAEAPAARRARSELHVWKAVLDAYFVDHNRYPAAGDCASAARILADEGYWEHPVTRDPWGRPYRCRIGAGAATVSSGGNSREPLEIDAEVRIPELPRASAPAARARAAAPAFPRAPERTSATTTIAVSKSGSDVVFTWTLATGQAYAGTRATNKAFFNALTMFSGLSAATYTYTGALTNGRGSEFFDITDTTEVNAGTVNNGGALPPIPPAITAPPSGTFYIGMTGATLTGSNFSTVAPDNAVWFPGGIQAFATAASATQLTFDIPPGALSGSIVSSVQNDLVSNRVTGDVYLENPTGNGLTIIRSMGFAPATGDYWFSGSAGGVSGLYRYAYDATTTKRWLRSNQSGTLAGAYNCSTRTDRFNRIFCAATITSTSGSANSRMAVTSPPGNLQTCRVIGLGILSSAGDSVRLVGAAADPNPDALAGRDMVYFVFQNVTRIPTQSFIVQVPVDATGCGAPSNPNYGNLGGAGLVVQTNVGMAVDRDGALYFSDGTTVRKIAFGGGTVTTVKSGFSRLFGLDVKQEVNGGPVSFLGADAPALAGNPSELKTWSSDNPAAPTVARNTTAERFAVWGATVAGPDWSVPQSKRNVAICNDNTQFPLDADYRVIATIATVDQGKTWISSPGTDPNDKGNPDQTFVRPSVGAASTDFSTMEVKTYWGDNIDRLICARSGDPQTSVKYEPAPVTPANCNRPWKDNAAVCDNKEPFVASGAGSFTESGNFEYCQATSCGGTVANACKFHVRISQRYAGDNYQLYFYYPTPSSATIPPEIIQTTAPFTAWKHNYIEKDRMCKGGGIIGLDAIAGANCVYMSKWYDGAAWKRVDNIAESDQIRIVDGSQPYETSADTAFAHINNLDYIDVQNRHYVEICLKQTVGGAPYSLKQNYSASAMNSVSPFFWPFSAGASAGVCVTSSGKYQAVTSGLNFHYDDAYTYFHTTIGNVVPYLPPQFFHYCTETGNCAAPTISCPDPVTSPYSIAHRNYSRFWFSALNSQSNVIQWISVGRFGQYGNCTTTCGNPQAMTLGVTYKKASLGVGEPLTKVSFIPVQSHQDYCPSQIQLSNLLEDTGDHELGHGLYANSGIAGGHDTFCAWNFIAGPPTCPVTAACMVPQSQPPSLMNPYRDAANFRHHFNGNNLFCGDPACPNGSEGCCSAPSATCTVPGTGAIRSLTDPLP